MIFYNVVNFSFVLGSVVRSKELGSVVNSLIFSLIFS